MARLQKELRGDDIDSIEKYYGDDGVTPKSEDKCTDLLIGDLQHLLEPLGIGRVPQRDMPAGKRADIVFTAGDIALPVEAKGQWNPALWRAPVEQLGALYARDWRSQGRGLYLVYWFGLEVPVKKKPRRKSQGAALCASAEELRRALIETMTAEWRANFAIDVIDLRRS